MRKILSIVLVLVLMVSTGIVVFADDGNADLTNEETTSVEDEMDSTTEDSYDIDEVEEDNEESDDEEAEAEKDNDDQDEVDEEGKPQGKAHGFYRNEVIKEERDQLETQKDAIEAEKDDLEDQLETLEDEIEEEEAAGNDTTKLVQAFNSLKEDHDQLKTQMRQKIMERRQLIKQTYSTEEMEQVEEAAEALEELTKEDQSMKVLPVDSIVSTNTQFKFDTPPVIKKGRTVVPVRAITEGFGAEVGWDESTKTVTITKEDISIALVIDSNIALVNGKEITFDSKSEIMNNRTYVPLRFISETLGLNVNWDEATETIAIDKPTEETDEASTDTSNTDNTETN